MDQESTAIEIPQRLRRSIGGSGFDIRNDSQVVNVAKVPAGTCKIPIKFQITLRIANKLRIGLHLVDSRGK